MTTLFFALLLLLLLYLLVGMAVYTIGSRSPTATNDVLVRRTDRRWVFVNEAITVSLTAKPIGLPRPETPGDPWSVFLVLDCSGSMSGGRLSRARQAAKNLVAAAPDEFAFAVVSFTTEARIEQPLTQNRVALNKALDRLQASGGTAIDRGLAAVEDQLENNPVAAKLDPRLTSVILCSDGGSEPQSALEQAKQLHQRGLTLYTVGLKGCDSTLLTDIAGDPAFYVYTEDADGISSLFSAIGQALQGYPAHGVTLGERPNVMHTPLTIPAWKGWVPAHIGSDPHGDRIERSLTWLLPVLPVEGKAVEYHLTSATPGWYRVNAGTATITLTDETGQNHRFSAKQGPYVLVLPRFPLIDVLRPFLNPLWWLFWQRFRKPRQYAPVFPVYQAPPQPPPVTMTPLPALAEQQQPDPTPALVIGLGHGGAQALAFFHKFLWEQDQDSAVTAKVRSRTLDSTNPLFQESAGLSATQLDPERRHTLGGDLDRAMETWVTEPPHARRFPWLDVDRLLVEDLRVDHGFGTHLNRAMGRARYRLTEDGTDFQNLRTQLTQDMAALTAGEQAPLSVCLVTTTGGGTGAGLLFDLCYRLRCLLDEQGLSDATIHLFLMDLPVADDDPRRESKRSVVETNRRAFFTELQRFHTCRAIAGAPEIHLKPVKNWFDQVVVHEQEANGSPRDLYAQTGLLLTQWLFQAPLREQLRTPKKEARTLTFLKGFHHALYQRTTVALLTHRLLLTVVGGRLLGLPEHPQTFTPQPDHLDEAQLRQAAQSLTDLERYRQAVPLLLSDPTLLLHPDEDRVSQFLHRNGFGFSVEHLTEPEVDDLIEKECDALEKLLAVWTQDRLTPAAGQPSPLLPMTDQTLARFILGCRQIADITTRLPAGMPESMQRRCWVLGRMCRAFADTLRACRAPLQDWLLFLGEAFSGQEGLCAHLNQGYQRLEQEHRRLQRMNRPFNRETPEQLETLYQNLFQPLELEVCHHLHWERQDNGALVLWVNHTQQPVVTPLPDPQAGGKHDRAAHTLCEILIQLAHDLARRQPDWATLSRALLPNEGVGKETQQWINQTLRETLVPALFIESRPAHHSLDVGTLPAGAKLESLDTSTPLASGIWCLTRRELDDGLADAKLNASAFVFTEEWFCHQALSLQVRQTNHLIAPPHKGWVSLCANPELWLGLMGNALLDDSIRLETIHGEARYTAEDRFEVINGDHDLAFRNLVRAISVSQNWQVRQKDRAGVTLLAQCDPDRRVAALIQAVQAKKLSEAETLAHLLVGGLCLLQNNQRHLAGTKDTATHQPNLSLT